jgi:hypothetical protein
MKSIKNAFNYSFLIIFGGVRFSVRNNVISPEYLNNLSLFSILDKRWIALQVSGTIPQPRHGHQVISNIIIK